MCVIYLVITQYIQNHLEKNNFCPKSNFSINNTLLIKVLKSWALALRELTGCEAS